MKKKLEKQAQDRNLIVQKKKSTFFSREVMPMFVEVYRGSSSEDEDEETQLMKAKVSRTLTFVNRFDWLLG